MAVVTQRCVGCGEQFTFPVKRGHRRRFCTKECHSASDQNAQVKKKYQISDKRKASNKKREGTDKRKASQKRYCQGDSGKSTYLKLNQRRRASMRGAFIQDVDVRVLLDLQGGACFLCSQPILSNIKHPDPMSLSLDHITPLARGGSHSYANCAATHLRCNLVKGVKSVDDVAPLLRLVS
jgi:5-methylcytosine-specific restriction endonuclease McrA